MKRRNSRASYSNARSPVTRVTLRVPRRVTPYLSTSLVAKRPDITQHATRHRRIPLRHLGSTVKKTFYIRVPSKVMRGSLKPSKFHVKRNTLTVHSYRSSNRDRRELNRRRYREALKVGERRGKYKQALGQVDSVKSDRFGLLAANRNDVRKFMAAAMVTRSLGG